MKGALTTLTLDPKVCVIFLEARLFETSLDVYLLLLGFALETESLTVFYFALAGEA